MGEDAGCSSGGRYKGHPSARWPWFSVSQLHHSCQECCWKIRKVRTSFWTTHLKQAMRLGRQRPASRWDWRSLTELEEESKLLCSLGSSGMVLESGLILCDQGSWNGNEEMTQKLCLKPIKVLQVFWISKMECAAF